jgi:hypothetical protein
MKIESKIVLTLPDGSQFELEQDEAREMYNELAKIFEVDKVCESEERPYVPLMPFPAPYPPTEPFGPYKDSGAPPWTYPVATWSVSR